MGKQIFDKWGVFKLKTKRIETAQRSKLLDFLFLFHSLNSVFLDAKLTIEKQFPINQRKLMHRLIYSQTNPIVFIFYSSFIFLYAGFYCPYKFINRRYQHNTWLMSNLFVSIRRNLIASLRFIGCAQSNFSTIKMSLILFVLKLELRQWISPTVS